ncbi:sensor histidine kinase [Rhodoplanes sp. Z2-YC6860]|uniref:sensor histidine kinase n=1 Tax=Rhodoplanes sp. Z2-YC6860 TaxID=674703 RepID=UPI00078BE44A|nr:PAS domain S-box protein [Rhodoplanes sp. Z2-YC6860]AMN38872.1 Signal transduction histidine kinase [Rhodoplanes sp. Z2-YC6860]
MLRKSGRPPDSASSLDQELKASGEILDLLPIATCICDASGRIVQYNRRAVELWGRTPEPGQTHDDFTAENRFLTLDGDLLPRSRIAEVLRTSRPIRNDEITVQRVNRPSLVVLLNIEPLLDAEGRLIGVINCFQDITERQRMVEALARSQQELREQEERWRASYEHAAIGIVEIDAEGRFLRVNEAILSIVGGTREELLGWRLFGRTHQDDRDVDGELYRKQVAGEIGFYSIEKRFIRRDGRMIWMGVRSSSVRDPSGKFLYGVRVVQDITERKEAETRQKLLIDELNHRVKNTLATVQSLAAQTARGTASTEAFHQAFEGRLIALSHAHDQLTRQRWQSADLRDIVKGATAPHLSRPDEQISIEGATITVSPRTALTMALVLHEMTTNAAKYGALSAPEGRIEIAWRVEPRPPKSPLLHIEWRERNGPPVEAPAKPGFGSRFIQGSVTVELRGSVRMDFNPDGLHCTIDVPLDPAADDQPHTA